MVKLFKKEGKKSYYFRVMIDGVLYQKSTKTDNKKNAADYAAKEILKLKGNNIPEEHLKNLIESIEYLSEEEREKKRNECVKALLEYSFVKIRIEDAFNQYREKPLNRIVGERTYTEYESRWNSFVEWLKLNFPEVEYLNEITTEIAEKYLISEWNKGIAERTYNDRIKKFRAMFNALKKQAGLIDNVWNTVSKKKENSLSKKMFTNEQLRNIFRVAEGELKILFLIGLYTGLRLGDVATLRWNEINFKDNLIVKTPLKTVSYQKSVEIPIHEVLKAALLNLRTDSDSEFVLPALQKRYAVRPSNLTIIIQKTLNLAGINTLSERSGATRKTAVYGFHSFRHSFISICANSHIPMHVVMDMVGHNSEVIHKIYQHADKEQKIKAIESLPKV